MSNGKRSADVFIHLGITNLIISLKCIGIVIDFRPLLDSPWNLEMLQGFDENFRHVRRCRFHCFQFAERKPNWNGCSSVVRERLTFSNRANISLRLNGNDYHSYCGRYVFKMMCEIGWKKLYSIAFFYIFKSHLFSFLTWLDRYIVNSSLCF